MEISSRATTEHYIWGENCDGWHLLRGAGLSVIEERVPPGAAEAAHFHRYSQQYFYVLAGQASMETSTGKVLINPNEGLAIPPGTPHRLVNESENDLVFLVISSPASHGDRVTVELGG